MRVRIALVMSVLALSIAVARAEPEHNADTNRFDAAIALEGIGRPRDAATALEAFARDEPKHALAADALAEAATLWEGRLHDPARALAAWSELAEKYPQSRSAHRAGERSAALARVLAGGDANAIGEFQQLLDDAGTPVSAAARDKVIAFLAAHPGFALADQGLYWLGQSAEERGLDREALGHYAEAVRSGGEYAPRAARSRAELFLRRNELDAARTAFDELARFPDPVSRAAMEAGRAAIVIHAERSAISGGLALALGVWVFVMLALGRRQLWPPPVELRFFLPIAVVFSLAAASEHRSIAGTVVLIALGGSLVVWLAGAAQRALRDAATWKRLGVGVFAAGAIVAVATLAIHANGMEDLVKETLRTGPER